MSSFNIPHSIIAVDPEKHEGGKTHSLYSQSEQLCVWKFREKRKMVRDKEGAGKQQLLDWVLFIDLYLPQYSLFIFIIDSFCKIPK